MPRKTLDSLSEPMFYVLMALQKQPLCGADIAQWVSERTEKRIVLGPGTLYTILGKLTDEQMINQLKNILESGSQAAAPEPTVEPAP